MGTLRGNDAGASDPGARVGAERGGSWPTRCAWSTPGSTSSDCAPSSNRSSTWRRAPWSPTRASPGDPPGRGTGPRTSSPAPAPRGTSRSSTSTAACSRSRTALAAGAAGPSALFLNIEPDGIPVGPPPPDAVTFAQRGGRLVLEFTERALTGDPARLQWFATRLRHVGIAVALDDVGSHPASLALLPFLRPEVVKLDQRLVQGPLDEDVARVAAAVGAYAERNDAVVLAEGIETTEHERNARALGATLGQGYLFGRPAALDPTPGTPPPAGPMAPAARVPEGPARLSPLAAVTRVHPLRRGPVEEVRIAATLLEQRARSAEGPTVLLGSVGSRRDPAGRA